MGPHTQNEHTLDSPEDWQLKMDTPDDPNLFLISRQAFITKMLDQWTLHVSTVKASIIKILHPFFQDNQVIKTDKLHFLGLVQAFESGFDTDDLALLYHWAHTANKTSEDTVSMEVMVRLVLKFKLGGMGLPFYKIDL